MTPSLLAGPLLQAFFATHLLMHKHSSPQTVASYRDTFRLLLNHLREKKGTEPSALHLTDLDAPAILSFLDHLEQQRANSVRSRNLRLAAIRSFFRFVSLRDPESLPISSRVLAIPVKRGQRKLVGYFTREEMEALLAAPDQSSWAGRRDHALLLTLYNSGARVSEVSSMTRDQIVFGSSAFLKLHGKGRKERTVPLWSKTARVLRLWFQESGSSAGNLTFPKARGGPLSRHGINYLLEQSAQKAAITCSSLKGKSVSAHRIRHSTAMHLLQSGVDLAIIALWLGHESMETTNMYIEADLAMKEKALKRLDPTPEKSKRFHPTDELMAFLESL